LLGSNTPVQLVDCIEVKEQGFFMLKVNISNRIEFLLLIYTGTDISLLKRAKLISSTEYDPEENVRVQSMNGLWIEMYGTESATVRLLNSSVTCAFQFCST
jgi:hypothetical protein